MDGFLDQKGPFARKYAPGSPFIMVSPAKGKTQLALYRFVPVSTTMCLYISATLSQKRSKEKKGLCPNKGQKRFCSPVDRHKGPRPRQWPCSLCQFRHNQTVALRRRTLHPGAMITIQGINCLVVCDPVAGLSWLDPHRSLIT